MIIVKKFLPIALAFSLIVNLSAQEESVLLHELSDQIDENSAFVVSDLTNEAVKTGFAAKLKQHKRAILIGLGCVAVVSAAGAVVYRSEIAEFFQKHAFGKKSVKKEKDLSSVSDNNPLNNNDSGKEFQPNTQGKAEGNGINAEQNNDKKQPLTSGLFSSDDVEQDDEYEVISKIFEEDSESLKLKELKKKVLEEINLDSIFPNINKKSEENNECEKNNNLATSIDLVNIWENTLESNLPSQVHQSDEDKDKAPLFQSNGDMEELLKPFADQKSGETVEE